MKVMFANATRKWGGEKTWALETARMLAARGHECVMVGRRGNRWVDACAAADLEAHGLWFGPDYNPYTILRMMTIARRRGTEVIVVNISKDLRAGCLVGAAVGAPVVRHVGLAWDLRNTITERWLYRRFLRGLVAVGHQMKQEMLERFSWLCAEDIEVIHIGKDVTRFCAERSSDLRRGWGVPEDALLIGVTSQIHPAKGHEYLFRAFSGLVRDGVAARLVVVGDGSHRAYLESFADDIGIRDRVHFAGFQQDIPHVLGNFDVFVLPSLSEGFPNTLVEAMASGLPCIATNISCVPEILDDGVNGFLVPPRDAMSLQKTLSRLCRDQQLRRQVGERARVRVEREFSLEDKVSDFERYLRRLLLRSPRQAGASVEGPT